MYFTRWIEMVHPVPGGPTFPEQKKRGHKKNIDIIVGDIAVKVDQPSKDMNMEIDTGDILEFEKNRDKITRNTARLETLRIILGAKQRKKRAG